ncbi:hypothetical protein JGH11_15385 [Dysgonomonas sp. Marseille-P4677]|uniref:hypothetical protein n=1 Tax=Dysgonomonas sp. Marseille-P4677 TaxID=2364790 RepID=UPI0019141AE3|nr:hypothetical protein [Dysgonomonas sp. Marseille-P4677]MBK5722258.1 hypothetical protein [Dysgonomonas sp. Marseille-P4677]
MQKIIVLLSIAVWMMSCQQDDIGINTERDNNEKDGIPVKISLSVEDAIDNQTGYVPMTMKRNDDEIKLKISNMYRVIIMKKIGDEIIIDSLATSLVDKSKQSWISIGFKAGENLNDLSLVLTPGEYYISVFTGFNFLEWNSHIRKGGIVANNSLDGTHTYACTYEIGSDSYSNRGIKYLGEEIFSGTTHFTVNKTEDLHSTSNPQLDNMKIVLKRNVTKYRIILHDYVDVDPYNSFFSNYSPPIIRADMVATEGKFVDGLDIWGNPWYNPEAPTKEMGYCTEALVNMIPIEDDGKYYLSTPNARVYAPYFFSKEGDNVKVQLSNFRVNFAVNQRYYKYSGTIEATLLHNNIDGIIFRPGTETEIIEGSPPATNLVLEMDGTKPKSPLEIFNSYAEFNFLQIP